MRCVAWVTGRLGAEAGRAMAVAMTDEETGTAASEEVVHHAHLIAEVKEALRQGTVAAAAAAAAEPAAAAATASSVSTAVVAAKGAPPSAAAVDAACAGIESVMRSERVAAAVAEGIQRVIAETLHAAIRAQQ